VIFLNQFDQIQTALYIGLTIVNQNKVFGSKKMLNWDVHMSKKQFFLFLISKTKKINKQVI